MVDQEIHPLPVTVALPAQIDAATAEQISAAFTPGVTVVIADLTSTACCDCAAIRHLLKAHRKHRPSMSAGVHHCQRRLSLSSSLGRSRVGELASLAGRSWIDPEGGV